MNNRIKKVIALALIISSSTTYISGATTIYTDSKTKLNEVAKNDVVKSNPEDNKENSYFGFKNIWGGDSLKILFDKETLKINAISKSGNFGNSNDNFTFKIIDGSTKETIINESADSKYVTEFTPKINGRDFKYGDIIELNVKPSSGLKSPTLYSQEKTVGTNCINKPQYFEITENGIIDYIPNIKVSPIKILGEEVFKEITITGSTDLNSNVTVMVEGKKFTTTSNENGEFSVEIESEEGFMPYTAIDILLGEVKAIVVYPELLSNVNMKQETNTGYSYIVNANIETLTTPFESNILFPRSLLSEEAKKAWDIAYKALLKYDNTEDNYPRDSAGNVQFYVDYESHGIKINATDAQYIQNYLVKNDPRLFLLKDWGASPVYKDGVIVGQNFYIGNSAQNGNDYQKQLLETEEAVSKILGKITPEMSVYQIIKTIQVEFEYMVEYRKEGAPSDIRGAFINKKAICGGYSKGFEYLLQRVGIENIWITGQAGGYHAWNHINLYGNWYLADTTWGGKNWYLRSGKDSTNHVIEDTYHVIPKLAKDSIPWELGDRGQTIANLTGVVNYENNNDGTIKITYEDKENINTTMHINTSLNEYKPVVMKKDDNGVFSANISYADANVDTVNFYFTVDEKFNTLGNVKTNNLKTENFGNGMKNIVLSTLNVSKNDLKELINKDIYKQEDYTKESFAKYTEVLEKANKIVESNNESSLEVAKVYRELQKAISGLVKVNKIEFKGYNNVVFMTLGFDTENKTFKATSNGMMVHPYQYSRVYAKVEHFDQKGNLKGSYEARANKTADEMANALNGLSYIKGDYIKISHLEKNKRLVINGYVENSPYDLSIGAINLDLDSSYFYLGEESLKYSSEQLDLSGDKTKLQNKIDDLKAITGENYTKTSFENLQNEIEKAEKLVNTTNVFDDEISVSLESLENVENNLRELNEVVVKGYNNAEIFKLAFDSENKVFKVVSSGEIANRFVSGKYAEIKHFDKKGNVKGSYSINANQNADALAQSLNNLEYTDGDYIKLFHAEKNNRLVVKGYIENTPVDLSQGAAAIDLNNSLFYLNGESFKYSEEELDLSADKTALISKIEEAKKISKEEYTKTSYENLQKAIAIAEELVKNTNVLEEEISIELENIQSCINDLRKVNNMEFKGYNNEVFMTLEFDTENKRFKALSNGKMVHPYQYGRVYAKVEHFDLKGNLKGTYQAIANQTADEMANALNDLNYENGDYIKLTHIEKDNRMVINGFVENSLYDLSIGSRDLDLNNSYFYLGDENLKYSNEQLDLSADKSQLIAKTNEAKNIASENYTKTSYENLLSKISESEELITSKNILESEINAAIENLNNSIENLREINKVEFKGYNNVVFMTLGFDKENNKFKAVSNGQMIHPYHGNSIYSTVYHYDKDNNLKGQYSIRANENADSMANALNEASISQGDYIKFSHLEQNSRLAIKGHINNLDINLSNGVGSLNLSNSIFNLDDENLTYITS